MKPELGFHYLAVDGPIGVGKTTLVEMLTSRYEGVKILEDVGNPFLGDFYQDKPGAAFQTELYFLLSRYKQQQDVAQRELFDRLLVSDYTFWKNSFGASGAGAVATSVPEPGSVALPLLAALAVTSIRRR